MSTTRKNPTVGPAPPPGRSQPIRENEDEDMDSNNDNGDDNDPGGGTPFTGAKDEQLAGMLMDVVEAGSRDAAYYMVDEIMTRLQKLRARIGLLEAARSGAIAAATAVAGSEDLREAISEAVAGAVAKAVAEEVGKATGELRKEIQELKKGAPTARS